MRTVFTEIIFEVLCLHNLKLPFMNCIVYLCPNPEKVFPEELDVKGSSSLKILVLNKMLNFANQIINVQG